MKATLTYCLLVAALLFGSVAISFAKPVRLETKFSTDSTTFTVKVEPGQVPTAGKSFNVLVHVNFKYPWHVYSSRMSDEGGSTPLSRNPS